MMGESIYDLIRDLPCRIGLEAQGHIQTIERMLDEGATWEAIGKAIGWCPTTAKQHWEAGMLRKGFEVETVQVALDSVSVIDQCTAVHDASE